ncbi:MAG: DUF1559 domain-containing protein [Gemmataceae bacterium]|nr:DUF1559 domain-containing protein [Gemmataceae bacterium]
MSERVWVLSKAGLALALGLASVLLRLGFLAGLPALLLGLNALRQANRSDGRLPGARLALAATIAGAMGILYTAAGVLSIIILRWRDTAGKAMSANNLRVIGNALALHSQARDRLPAATTDPPGLPPEQRLSWMADCLPFLGDSPKAKEGFLTLAEAIDRRSGWDAPANQPAKDASVRYFLVPSHPDYKPRSSPGLSHYVGVAGDGADAASLKREDKRAGVFGHDRGIVYKEATAGVSNTLAAIETGLENGPWIAGGHPTVRGIPDDPEPLGPGRPFGGLHHRATYGLWLDGSARPLREDIDEGLLRRLARLRRE